jgi:ribosomal-protein-alanine N-acetyltransferase
MVLKDAEISIGAMREEDIPSVREIDDLSFPTPWPHEAYIRELRDNRLACYIVARTTGGVVGYAGMWIILDEAHVTTIAVAPELRGRRIGERLLVSLIAEALHRGAHWVTLEVRRSNRTAQGLYRKYGFKEIGVRRGYYSDNREDAIVMWTGNLHEPAFQERYTKNRAMLERLSFGPDTRV